MALSITKRDYDHHTEQIHAAGGERVRDLMLGLNDGLVASLAVTSGVSGAFTARKVVIMAGLSEMLGGAVSMGLAAFISARSQIEFYHSEIEREQLEMRKWPDRERDEIRSIYRAKGFTGKLLDDIVTHITSDQKRWSDVMMREELGFSGDFDSPLRSGATVGLSYLCGATVPVLPYLFVEPAHGVVYSALATLVALFIVGAAKTIITTRSWWRSGLESALTGAAAAAATFAAGSLFARL
jgi:VIT1/CCC1 family predicted Fe2+/Mn2+ transporter